MARLIIRLIAWAGLLYMVLPLVVIVGTSLTAGSVLTFPPEGLSWRWYGIMLDDRSYLSAYATSTVLALAATVVAVILAVPATLAIARYDFPGKATITATLMSPLVLPNIVIGAALLQYGSAFGLTRNFAALLVGHTIIIMPFILRSVLAMMTPGQRALEEASMDLGANAFTTFRLVILPLIRPGLVTGAIFAFISSWINVELSIFHTTAQLDTIPVKLFNYIQYTIDPTIAAVAALTIIVAAVAIVLLDLTIGLDVLSSPEDSQ
ncbi:MAG: ABC transporter permease [Candidimonas sp.]|jgi:putative spermidine/putrescine transport system permease protein